MGISLSMDLEQSARAGICSEPVTSATLQRLEIFADLGQKYFDSTGNKDFSLVEIEAWQLLGQPENPVGHQWEDKQTCLHCGEINNDLQSRWCPWNTVA